MKFIFEFAYLYENDGHCAVSTLLRIELLNTNSANQLKSEFI